MPSSYNIEDRTPEQYGIKTWNPPASRDGSEMRSRYVEPYLDELHQDHELFHPAGPYASGQSQYNSNQNRNRINNSRRSDYTSDYGSDISLRGTRYTEPSYHLRPVEGCKWTGSPAYVRAPSTVHPGSSVSHVYERYSELTHRPLHRYEGNSRYDIQKSGSRYTSSQLSGSSRLTDQTRGSTYSSGTGSHDMNHRRFS